MYIKSISIIECAEDLIPLATVISDRQCPPWNRSDRHRFLGDLVYCPNSWICDSRELPSDPEPKFTSEEFRKVFA